MARFDTIQYFAFATTADAVDFGDLSAAKDECSATGSNGTIGLVAGGRAPTNPIDVIEYVTIATTGDVTDFGNLTAGTTGVAGATNGVRMLIAGGIQ